MYTHKNISEEQMNEYYYRVFVKQSEESNKLSALSYRLAGLLIKELDFYEPRKLPKRKILAEKLGVSKPPVIDALAYLEKIGFIIRSTELQGMILADSSKQEEFDRRQKEICEKNKEERKFKDNFRLNFYYNTSKEEMLYNYLKQIIQYNAELVAVYSYLSSLGLESKKEIIKKVLKYDIVKDIKKHYHFDDDILYNLIEYIFDNSKLKPCEGKNNLFYVYINENDIWD